MQLMTSIPLTITFSIVWLLTWQAQQNQSDCLPAFTPLLTPCSMDNRFKLFVPIPDLPSILSKPAASSKQTESWKSRWLSDGDRRSDYHVFGGEFCYEFPISVPLLSSSNFSSSNSSYSSIPPCSYYRQYQYLSRMRNHWRYAVCCNPHGSDRKTRISTCLLQTALNCCPE